MTKKVSRIPEGFHTITPGLVVRDAARAIDFYKRAFGAEELVRMPGPDGRGVMHAELRIGDSVLFVGDEAPSMGSRSPQALGGTAVALHLYVEDVDKAFKRAIDAGAQVKMPVADMFWGDRYGKIADPFGHEWGINQQLRELSPEESQAAADEFLAQRR